MIKLFKDLRIIRLIVLIIIGIAFIALEIALLITFVDMPFSYVILLLIAAYSAMLIVSILFTQIALRRYKAVSDIYNENCDPYTFLKKQFEFKNRKVGVALNRVIILNIATAYNSMHDIENMQKALDDINGKFMHPVITALKMCLQSNTYFQRGEFENCRLLLNQAKDINDKSIRNKENKRTVEFSYTTGIASLQIRQGQTEGVEELLVPYLSPDRYMLERVSASYILAELYYLQGRAEEEIQALQFVAQNGNRLYIADKARKRLSEIHKLS